MELGSSGMPSLKGSDEARSEGLLLAGQVVTAVLPVWGMGSPGGEALPVAAPLQGPAWSAGLNPLLRS